MEWHPSKFNAISFCMYLRGMNTAIGTPPNIIIEYKATISTTDLILDYSYVGIVITIISVLFIAWSPIF